MPLLPASLVALPDRPQSGGPPPAGVARELEGLAPLQMRLGYGFARPALLRVALTHRSWAQEHREAGWPHNGVLEFLGDAVLDLLAADAIWRKFPDLHEGDLTRLRSMVVSRPALARAAQGMQLGDWLWLGRGQARQGGREHPRTLADAVEAVLGAVFLDAREAGGDPLQVGATVFQRLLGDQLDALTPDAGLDPKSRLAQMVQSKYQRPPVYVVERGSHDPAAPHWVVRVEVEDADGTRRVLGRGEGRSQRLAQRRAAEQALEEWAP